MIADDLTSGRKITRDEALRALRFNQGKVLVEYDTPYGRRKARFDEGSPFYRGNGPYNYAFLRYFLIPSVLPKKPRTTWRHGGNRPEPTSAPTDSEDIPEEKPELEIRSIDDHFAPSREKLVIRYDIKQLRDKKVTLKVTGTGCEGNPLFKIDLHPDKKTDGEHSIMWDGRCNTESGPLKGGLFINPLHTPYQVQLVSDGPSSQEEEFKVLYHSVQLYEGTYTADGKAPDKSERVKWVQFRLNELGYFSGPVDGIKGPQTSRALKRYTYARPGYYGNPPKKEIDDENNPKLLEQLEKGEGKRVLWEGGRLPKKGDKAKLYLDHDYYYEVFSNADFSHPQGHCRKDLEKLDRVEFPLETKILLVSKRDADGTNAGVDAPEAVGAAEIEWEVIDPPENTAILPQPTTDIPSRTKAYIEKALEKTRTSAGDKENDNCPKVGNVGTRDKLPDLFRVGDRPPPFSVYKNGDRVFSKVNNDGVKSPDKVGRTGVLFRGSLIAGDNYRISARLSFEHHRPQELEKLHEDFSGTKPRERLLTETGEFTIWRRSKVAAVVDWPDPGRNIDWSEIASAYSLSHYVLETGNVTRYRIEDLLSSEKERLEYIDLVAKHFPHYKKSDMRFDPNGLYPFAIRAQKSTETPEEFRTELRSLLSDFSDEPNFQDDLALLLHNKVAARREPGAIVFRPNWVRPTKVHKPIPVLGLKNIFKSEEYLPGFVCLGLPKGVALLDNGMTDKEQDGFLYVHEMGHCRYLMHHETRGNGMSDIPEDHDLADKNCTMCYPNGIKSRPGLSWNKGDKTESRFCGKCILKLRGWDVRAAKLPASS